MKLREGKGSARFHTRITGPFGALHHCPKQYKAALSSVQLSSFASDRVASLLSVFPTTPVLKGVGIHSLHVDDVPPATIPSTRVPVHAYVEVLGTPVSVTAYGIRMVSNVIRE